MKKRIAARNDPALLATRKANLAAMFEILEKLPPGTWGKKSQILKEDQNRDWTSTILRVLELQGYVLRSGLNRYRPICRRRDLSDSLLGNMASLSSGFFVYLRRHGTSYASGLRALGIPTFKPAPDEEGGEPEGSGEIAEPPEPEVIPQDAGVRSSEGEPKESEDNELRAAIGEILYVVRNTVPDLIRGVGELLEAIREISAKVNRLHSEWFPEKEEG